MECEFKRESEYDITFDLQNDSNVNIETNYQIKDIILYVTLSVSFGSLVTEKKEINSFIKMLGIFEKFGEAQVSFEEFGTINGPAILYPFVRELLASLTVRSGLGTVLLPPINFVTINQQKAGK